MEFDEAKVSKRRAPCDSDASFITHKIPTRFRSVGLNSLKKSSHKERKLERNLPKAWLSYVGNPNDENPSGPQHCAGA
jgi:hypothetical protein